MPVRNCPECLTPFSPVRHDQVFCSGGCRFADHNRAMQRGREAYRALYHWRFGQGKGQRASLLGTISSMAKRWVEEDKAEGRGPPPLPEEMQRRLENARTGYVRVTGAAYRRDPEQARLVVEELSR